MARPNDNKPVSRRFMIMEAASHTPGGFPGHMNAIMDEMIMDMRERGLRGPYKWTFSGGDGYAVPIVLECSV